MRALDTPDWLRTGLQTLDHILLEAAMHATPRAATSCGAGSADVGACPSLQGRRQERFGCGW